MTDRSAKLRSFYARYVTRRAGATDPRIEAAFAAVPREPFVGPAPWHVRCEGFAGPQPLADRYVETPDDDPAFLYHDVLVALDPARGINVGQPSLHALCLDAVAPRPGDTVLQVGAGSGYYTAILAHLVGPEGRVHAFEIDPALAMRAERNLAPWPSVRVEARSGIAEDLPKSDIVYVSAAATQPSWAWLDALLPGGRLIFPLHPVGTFGGMLRIERPPDGAATSWPARFVMRAAFIPCEGGQNEETGRGLAAAFAGGGFETVRALRFDDVADATCWFRGDGWWLSTDEPASAPPPQSAPQPD